MNWWETLSRHWTPRRPSPDLRARLFGVATRGPSETDATFPLRWLAPVACGLILLLGVVSDPRGPLGPWAGASRLLADASLASRSAALFQPAEVNCRRNALPTPSLGWTNTGRSPSSIGSILLVLTNSNLP